MKKNAYRFLLLGVGAFVIDYGLTLILHYVLGITGYVASGASFVLGFIFSFSLSRRWVFRSKTTYKQSAKKQITYYFTLAAMNLIISSVIIAKLSEIYVDVYISKAFTIALIASWNFVICHFFIFAENVSEKS